MKLSEVDGIIDLVDELTYINYRYNREISPHITPERWEKSYGPQVRQMEERFQREIANPPTAGEVFRFENPCTPDEYEGGEL